MDTNMQATTVTGDKAQAQPEKILLEVKDLSRRFSLPYSIFDAIFHHPRQAVSAVNGVSLSIHKGETLGLVGESGCGKSTLARVIIGLYRPSEGSVALNGTDLSSLPRRKQRECAAAIQMIFQDPYSSLNPRMTVRQVLREVLLKRGICGKNEVDKKISHLMDLVGLSPEHADRLPSAFSGGQRQRIGIARALASSPELIIADEPVSALDVSIQAQIINLLIDLKERLDLSMLFISHDLRVVRYISDRVAVMYLGTIVETAETTELYEHPRHPYTKMLLDAAPSIDADRARETHAQSIGELPSPIDIPSGCCFHPRCPYADEQCARACPSLHDFGNGHKVACHHPLMG